MHKRQYVSFTVITKQPSAFQRTQFSNDRTKHVEIDRHFIKEKLEGKIISLPFVRLKDQLADIFTKAVSSEAFSTTLRKLGIGDPTTQLEGECRK